MFNKHMSVMKFTIFSSEDSGILKYILLKLTAAISLKSKFAGNLLLADRNQLIK
jgi:hypothetical protein